MEKNNYQGPERRRFFRLDYVSPLAYKVCKEETISKLLAGYTSNVSQSGLLCNIRERVNKDDILWLCFDKDTLDICTDMEKRCLVYQSGVVGKVVRIEHRSDNTFNVGIQFITREEKNFSHIYPKIYFIEKTKDLGQKQAEEDNGQEA